MNSQVDRRDFMRSAGVGLCTLLGASSVASGKWTKLSSGDSGKYDVYETDKKWDKDFLYINWTNPGGLMSGSKNFDPDYLMYFTKTKENGDTYLHNTKPSVGINPFRKNGFRLRASPGNEEGEMRIILNPNVAIGGFYEDVPYGRTERENEMPGTATTIKKDREAVRISIEAGEVSIARKPDWSFPVVEWEDYAGRAPTGGISTGNVYIQIRDGRVTSVNDKAMSPLIYGASPFFLRFPKTESLFISRNGRVVRTENIVR